MKELEVYIHIPFCVRKCRYCDFLSAPADESIRTAYVERLVKEIATEAKSLRDYEVCTVFIGGGTPSLLFPAQTEQILQAVYDNFSMATDVEITMEVNPGTASELKFREYKKIGINRISFGLQDTNNERLKTLGRIHTYEDFLDNYTKARKAGIENINIDILSALPDQTVTEYEKTLKKVCKLQPEHISAYSLIIEEGTPFYQLYGEEDRLREEGRKIAHPHLPSEEMERIMYRKTKELLTDYGYERYEISNYAKKGKQCRHNVGYWKRIPYRGFGLGAASLIEKKRFTVTRDLSEYLSTRESCVVLKVEEQTLSVQDEMEETMFLGLRMMQGVEKYAFYQKFGKTMSQVYGQTIDKLMAQGLLAQNRDFLYLTEQGISVSNYVMSEFLLD